MSMPESHAMVSGALLPPPRPPWRGWRWIGWTAAVLAAMAGVALAIEWPFLHGEAQLATAYGARIGCSCHYIGGRAIGDCHKDFEPGMGLVSLSLDDSTRTVTARMVPLASDSATFVPGQGCVPAAWK